MSPPSQLSVPESEAAPDIIYAPWTGNIRTIAQMRAEKADFKGKLWYPPRPDSTLPDPCNPTYRTDNEAYARRFYEAMISMDPAKVRDNLHERGTPVGRTAKRSYDPKWIECQAWELVDLTIDLHTYGSALPIGADISSEADKVLKFADRISAIERTLTEWKTVCDDVYCGDMLQRVVYSPSSCWTHNANAKHMNDGKATATSAGRDVIGSSHVVAVAAQHSTTSALSVHRGRRASAPVSRTRLATLGAVDRLRAIAVRGVRAPRNAPLVRSSQATNNVLAVLQTQEAKDATGRPEDGHESDLSYASMELGTEDEESAPEDGALSDASMDLGTDDEELVEDDKESSGTSMDLGTDDEE